MPISSVIQNSAKADLLRAGTNFNTSIQTPAGHAFKLALYLSTTTIDTTTTAYGGPTNEVATATGYTGGGKALTNTGVGTTTVTSFTDFSDVSWTSASFTTRGCLIYNTTSISGLTADRAVCYIYFGGYKTVSSGTFTIQFPTNDASDAIIRITS
jgi:hypothetical protein